MTPRVLVTGATGFIGLEVARQLAGAGVHARLMVHRPHRAAYVRGLSDDLAMARLEDEAQIARAVEGADAVIHLAGHATFERHAVVRPTLVDGTARLARLAAAAGVGHFVFASSTLVYDGSSVADEHTAPAPWTGYGRAKLEAEDALERTASSSSMTIASLRLPHVYGARDALFGMARRGFIVSPGRGNAPFSHLHVEDAARVLIAAAMQRWIGTTPVADDAPASWRTFTAQLRVAFPRLRELRIPAVVARIGATIPAAFARVCGRPTLLTPEAVAGWNRSLVVAPRVLWASLGLTPSYPTIATGIPAAARESVAGWSHPVHDHWGRRFRAP